MLSLALHLYQGLSWSILVYVISIFEPLFPSELKKRLYNKGTDPAEVQKIIDALINANLLRYNANGRLVLHNRLVEFTASIVPRDQFL